VKALVPRPGAPGAIVPVGGAPSASESSATEDAQQKALRRISKLSKASKASKGSKRGEDDGGSSAPGERRRSRSRSLDKPDRRSFTKESRASTFSKLSLGSQKSFLSRASSASDLSVETVSTAQLFVFGTLGFAVFWAVSSSVLLLLSTFFYRGGAIDEACERYAVASASRVGAEVASVLSAALAARDALDYAVQRKLYFEPLDTTAVRAILEPVFAAKPALRAVDLAFAGREESLSLRRRVVPGEAGSSMLVQSDAADCSKLGPMGCMSAEPGRLRPWYQVGLKLPGGQEAGGGDSNTAFVWAEHPGFLPCLANASGANAGGCVDGPDSKGATVQWLPAYSLIFRSVFPGSNGNLSVIGLATMEVSGLRMDSRLVDEAGGSGSVFIADRGGNIIAADQQGQQALVQKSSGLARFRKVWELALSWAQELEAGDFAGGGKQYASHGYQVVVSPVEGRGMDHFSAIVAAETAPFIDSNQHSLGTTAIVIVLTPYPGAFAVYLGLLAFKEYQRRKEMKKKRAMVAMFKPRRSNTWTNKGIGDVGSLRKKLEAVSARGGMPGAQQEQQLALR